MFCPSQDLFAAAFLLEADSVEAVRDYIEVTLGPSRENSYFEINAEFARGLPESPIREEPAQDWSPPHLAMP
jgi:hypothetical protein